MTITPCMEKRNYFKYGIILVIVAILIFSISFLGQERELENAPVSSLDTSSSVEVRIGEWIELIPTQNYSSGLIFYQGGNVQAEAYVPLLRPLAENGVLVVIPKSPLALSIFAPNDALGVMRAYENITNWVVAGHSLGGVSASIFTHEFPNTVQGLILIASTPNSDISMDTYSVLSISADKDGLFTPSDVEMSKEKLPESTQYVSIPGGNHAYFGYYGSQEGDGVATITREDQHLQVFNLMNTFVSSLSDNLNFKEPDRSSNYNFLYPSRDIANDLSSRNYLTLILINLIFLLVPLALFIQAMRIYISTKNFRKEIAPILTVISFMFISRLLPLVNRYVGLNTAGTREFVINQIQANILPYAFIFNAFATMLVFYIRVPSRRRGRFNWTIRLARLAALSTGVATVGFLIAGLISGENQVSSGFNYFAYTLFLVIVTLLFVVYRILSIEQKDSKVKITVMKLSVLKLLVAFTIFYLITALILTFGILFSPLEIDFYTSAILLTGYSCVNSTLGSFLALWIVNSPDWLKERYGITIPKNLDM